MKKISKEVIARWLLLYTMDRVTVNEMLNHFRNHYDFEGCFQELIEELIDQSTDDEEEKESKKMKGTDVEAAMVRKSIEAEIADKTTKKVRNVFFLCRSAGDLRRIYAVAGNNNQIFAIAFVDEYNQVEVVI